MGSETRLRYGIVRRNAPNKALRLTASSVRFCVAPASGRR